MKNPKDMTIDEKDSWLKTEKQKEAYESIPREIHEREEKFLKTIFKSKKGKVA